MLRVQATQVDTLWDPLLPAEVRALPQDLARLDQLLSISELLDPFKTHWEHEHLRFGRPTIPMASYLRLMVIKQRMGWGYETSCARWPIPSTSAASAYSRSSGQFPTNPPFASSPAGSAPSWSTS